MPSTPSVQDSLSSDSPFSRARAHPNYPAHLVGRIIVDNATPPPARNLSQHIARRALYHWGWTLLGAMPRQQGYILVAAPHTSNWDFVFAMLVTWGLGLKAKWLGKAALFKPPFGWIMRLWGGIPVDRSRANSLVEQVAATFQENPAMRLLITPEGTRSKRPYWKTGFYHIALGAGIPIKLGFIDIRDKEVGFAATFYPSGDIEADMALLRDYYQGKQGWHPEKASEVRLRPELRADSQTQPGSQ